MNRPFPSLLLLWALILTAASATQLTAAPPAFPLRVSENRRHLVDQSGEPFLVVGDTAWSLIAQLKETEIAEYLDDRAQRGFNSIIVNLIEHKFATKAPSNLDGVAPFAVPGDFAHPNSAYFDYAHRAVAAARQRGISVWLCPAYLGWDGKDEGFFQKIKVAGPAALRAYGRFVGERFKDLANIVWMPGGDYALPVAERWAGQELALGLREGGANQIMTAHGGQTSGVATFGDHPWLEIDSVYRYQEDLWRPLQAAWRNQPVRPFALLETTYEGEHKATPDQIRRQAWWAMLCGAGGQFFGNNPIWYFDGPGFTDSKSAPTWRQALDGTGTRDIARLGAFFRQRPWSQLVPDLENRLLTAGADDGAARVTTAATPDWNLAVLYIPAHPTKARSLTLNLGLFAAPVSARWFNPAKDAASPMPVAVYPNRPQQRVSTPGENGTGTNDWVLVLEPADPLPSLVDLAQKIRPGFLLGSFASGLETAPKERSPMAKFFRHNFNIMTVGVYMQSTQPRQGGYDFRVTDALIDFAQGAGIQVYLHPLIGGAEYTPGWVYDANLPEQALRQLLRDRIATILARYKGRVQYVDVVNEALVDQGRTSDGKFLWQEKAYRGPDHLWMKRLGMYQGKKHQFPQYLVEAFRTARESGGGTLKLILNEWGNETTKSMRGIAFLNLIQALREEGIPVDGAGLQLHCRLKDGVLRSWANDQAFDLDAFTAMLKLYEQAGIEVHITEFDIHLPVNPTDHDFTHQGVYYARILERALQSPAVKSFKTWGFTDRHSWKADNQDGHPLLLNEDLQPKPAYTLQLEMLRRLMAQTKNPPN